ncbi:echinoderm microtubule-associated protein-like CG42247, partial [Sitophilus oryzae]
AVAPSRAGSRMQQYDDAGLQEAVAAAAQQGEGGAATGAGEDADVPAAPDPNALSLVPAAGNGAQHNQRDVSDDEDDDHPVANGGGYWRQGAATRPSSPPMADNASDASSMQPPAPRSKSRVEMATSRYSNLGYWKARRVLFYKNGDPFFPGVEFRFKPGRDIVSLESLLDKLSLRMDLPRG